jgi:hypothetical protein
MEARVRQLVRERAGDLCELICVLGERLTSSTTLLRGIAE